MFCKKSQLQLNVFHLHLNSCPKKIHASSTLSQKSRHASLLLYMSSFKLYFRLLVQLKKEQPTKQKYVHLQNLIIKLHKRFKLKVFGVDAQLMSQMWWLQQHISTSEWKYFFLNIGHVTNQNGGFIVWKFSIFSVGGIISTCHPTQSLWILHDYCQVFAFTAKAQNLTKYFSLVCSANICKHMSFDWSSLVLFVCDVLGLLFIGVYELFYCFAIRNFMGIWSIQNTKFQLNKLSYRRNYSH